MLVLSRKPSESVQIDSTIEVKVVSIGKGRVKLGITAPDHIRIVRNELIGRGRGEAVTREEASPRDTQGDTLASTPRRAKAM